MGRVLLMTLALCACTRPVEQKVTPPPPAPPPVVWPKWPATPAEAAELVKAQTKTAPGEALAFDPAHAWEAAEHAGWQKLPAGERRVQQWIRNWHADWLLAGSFHDSPDQARAFHRLVAPGGVGPFGTIALEQLRAPGGWLETDAGMGDSAALAKYLSSGSEADFAALHDSHLEHDYTAWKYGYDDEVLQVIVSARAQNVPVSACDVPDALQERLRDDDDSLRLRELHCRLTLSAAKKPVAMLWGQAHVWPEGFRRYLGADEKALSLIFVGGRHSADAPDSEFRDRLVLNDPVLIPAREGYAWLWIPDRFTAGDLNRGRVGADPTAPAVFASSEEPGTLTIGDVSLELREEEKSKPLPAGEYTYLFRTKKGLSMVGSVEVPEQGTVVFHFEPAARCTHLTMAGPKYR